MASKLTSAQSWELTRLRTQCTVYGAKRLRILIDDYWRAHVNTAIRTRPEHVAMVAYFTELFQLTVNNQLTKQ